MSERMNESTNQAGLKLQQWIKIRWKITTNWS